MKKIAQKIATLFQNNKKNIILLFVLIFAVLLVMDYNSRMGSYNIVMNQMYNVQTQEGKMALTAQFLKTEIAYATSEAGVIDWAREEGMILPGDIPVVPLVPMEVTPTPTPLPSSKAISLQNWQIWFLLFFGD